VECVLVHSGLKVDEDTLDRERLPEFDYDGQGAHVQWDTVDVELFDNPEDRREKPEYMQLLCECGESWLALMDDYIDDDELDDDGLPKLATDESRSNGPGRGDGR
jgi:hypothetical protein